MMKTKLRVLLVILPLLGGARLAATFNEAAPLFTRLTGTVIVPAEVSDHALFVQVMINGRGPFRMLVDTGSSISVIRPAVASAVGAQELPAGAGPTASRNAFGDEAEVGPVVLRTVEIGGVRFEGVPAGVADGFDTLGQVNGRPLDGLLGFSIFSDLVVAVDFPRRQLLFSANWPEGLPPTRAELAVRERNEVPYVSARLQGRDFDVLIDTGSNRSLSLPPDAAAAAAWRAEPRPGALVAAMGEAGREYIGRLAGELHLGRVTQTNPIAAVIDGAPSIGVGFLKGFCVVFDQSRDRMWLCSESDEPVPAPAAHSLGLNLLADPAGWRVAGTIPGSPAEGAGIAPGDVVTEIEGKSARAWSRDKIDEWTDAHEKVALRVARTEQSREFVLPAWPLVP